jgi:hypothetical protein
VRNTLQYKLVALKCSIAIVSMDNNKDQDCDAWYPRSFIN